MKTMEIKFTLLWFSLFTTFSFAKIITPRFPSSIINRPEQLSVSTNEQKGLYKSMFFTQTLDHFNYNPQSYDTFQQRYLINDSYWGGAKNNAPIFVYTGNEGEIEWFAQNTGFMFETAPSFRALLIFIEHRFYGQSMPFGGDKNIAYKNSSTLGYLSSTQALADYATLIIDLKKNLSATDSPVVVFGGSYGGMLAAWFRLKYPHVTIGALSSSSPILLFENISSPYAFNNIITQDFRSESENCYKVIKGSWQQIEDTANQPGGLEVLRKSFRICENYISASSLEGWLQTAYVYTAMTDYPTPSNFLNPMPAYPIKQAIQHAHSFSIQSFENRERLVEAKREISDLQKTNKGLQSKMKKLEDQAEAAVKAQNNAEEKAEAAEAIRKVAEAQKKEAEKKMARAESELQEALATKNAEIKEADEKVYAQGMADVIEAYELQVKQACNKGFTLGWMSLLRKLNVPEDSPLRKADAIPLPFPPPPPTESEDDAEPDDGGEEEDGALVRKPKDTEGAKSSSLNEQVLDLTQDNDGDEVSKEAVPGMLSSDALLFGRGIDETVAEIDAEIAAEKAAEVPSQLSSELQTQSTDPAEEA